MQHDDVIWGSLNNFFCSYKVTTVKQKFCRNKYNISGLCDRRSCPLANSRYATIVENEDKLYLFVKTAERAHSPRNLWERIKLSTNYVKALTQIDQQLEYWPQVMIHKAKQRLTKMTQYLIRKRRLQLRSKTRLVGIKKKIDRREKSREEKAINAAKLEASIEKELLERLKNGAYGDIYNFAQEEYEKVLDGQLEEEMEGEDEGEEDADADAYEAQYEDDSEDEMDQDIEDGQDFADEGYDFDDDEDSGDEDDLDRESRDSAGLKNYVKDRARRRAKDSSSNGTTGKGTKGRRLRKKPRGGVRIEVEYEKEANVERTEA